MRSSVGEIVRTVLVCIAVMLALPAAYRIWMTYHPQPVDTGNRLTQFLEKSAEDRALRLLTTPLTNWTEDERKSEPKTCAWLKAHEKTVLPWEWSGAARRKDPEGHRRLWVALFRDQASELKAQLKAEEKKLKTLGRELQVAETLYAHRTNQLARIRAYVATNAFPMILRVERLSKGRFWGWNAKEELVKVVSRENFSATSNGWFQTEHRQVREEHAALADLETGKRRAAERVAALPALASHMSMCADSASKKQPLNESWALKELLDAVNR